MNNRPLHLAACFCGQSDEYQRPLLSAMTDACVKNNIKLSVFLAFSDMGSNAPVAESVSSIFSLLNPEKFDGLILFPMYFNDDTMVRMLIGRAKEAGIPVVCVDGAEEDCYNIRIDYDESIEMITSHFIEHHGFTRINYIGGTPGHTCTALREASYRRAMESHGLPVEEKRIGCGMFWSDPAAACLREYYNAYNEMPQAVVCANDSMALGVIHEIEALGYSVPKDVCVSGMDGTHRARNHCPSVTTAAPSLSQAARLAVDTFLSIHKGEIAPIGETSVDCVLYLEESCGCKTYSHAEDCGIKDIMFREIDNHTSYLSWSKRTAEAVTDINSLEDFRKKLEQVAADFWSGKCLFCLCDDYFSADQTEQRAFGYSDMINPIAATVDHKAVQFDPFPVGEIIPDFDQMLETGTAMIFAPLYFTNCPIGYIAAEFSSISLPLDMLANLACTLGVLLENTKNRLALRNMVEQLQNLSVMDAMTGLHNRRGFYMKMSELFEGCAHDHAPFMTIAIDLDGLKAINDNYGHKEGDNAIQTIAKLLKEVCGDSHIAARFGGDEFVIAGRYDPNAHPEQLIHTIESRLNELNAKSGREYQVGMSCGWYLEVPSAENFVDEWIAIADERMYSVKKVHKNRIRNRR